MEQENFTEFERVKLKYRRSLIPWWIWFIMALLLGFNITVLVIALTDIPQGGVFGFSFIGVEDLTPYPYSAIISSLLIVAFAVTSVMLWQEKAQAVLYGRGFALVGLLICIVVFINGIIIRGTVMGALHVETVFFLDYFFRLNDIRYEWKYGAVSRYNG